MNNNLKNGFDIPRVSFRYYELRFFSYFTFFHVFFSVESENGIALMEKAICKKLFNFKLNYSPCNIEEMITFIFTLFQGKKYHRHLLCDCYEARTLYVIYLKLILFITVSRYSQYYFHKC